MDTKRVLIIDALNAYLRAYIVDPSISTNGDQLEVLKDLLKFFKSLYEQQAQIMLLLFGMDLMVLKSERPWIRIIRPAETDQT